MRSRHRVPVTVGIAVALTCAGCGTVTDAGVIRDWAQALSAGDIAKAASYFALPAIVQNATPPVRITSRAQAREFNQLLPCGARLLMTARHGGYIYATFRLTNRVGGNCGSGIGGIAATAFRIHDGKITEWRRLPGPGQGSPRTPTPTPAPGHNPAV
jgi:ketosteroid isomerase-like protein